MNNERRSLLWQGGNVGMCISCFCECRIIMDRIEAATTYKCRIIRIEAATTCKYKLVQNRSSKYRKLRKAEKCMLILLIYRIWDRYRINSNWI